MPSGQEVKAFLQDTGRALVLKDFWADCPASIALGVSLVGINGLRAITTAGAPVLLSLAVKTMTGATPDGALATKYLYGWIGALGGEKLLTAVNSLILSYFQTRFGRKLGLQVMQQMHHVCLEDYQQVHAASVPNALIRMTEQTSLLLTKVVNEFWPLIFSLSLSAVALHVDLGFFDVPTLSAAATGLLWGYSALNLGLSVGYAFVQRGVNEETQRRARHFMQVLDEDISNERVIRAYDRVSERRDHEQSLFKTFLDYIIRNDANPAWYKLIAVKGILFFTLMMSIYLVSGTALNVELFDELVLLLNYLLIFHAATESFGEQILATRGAIASIRDLEELLTSRDENLQMIPAPGPVGIGGMGAPMLPPSPPLIAIPRTATIPAIQAQVPVIEFRNVSYTPRQALAPLVSNISFRVLPGESCALVGETGAGKSTIINLLCGFYEPTAGQVFINGIDIATVDRADLRRALTLIDQDVSLFSTVENTQQKLQYNVLFGHPTTASDRRMAELRSTNRAVNALTAAETAQFTSVVGHALIPNLAATMSSPSGGERQRIGLARGWRQTPIMILDEPTSAVDTLTEDQLIRNFNQQIRAGHTGVLLVTGHRLKTVEGCNQILVMQAGQIIQQGAHQQLIATPGFYQQAHTVQTNTPSFR